MSEQKGRTKERWNSRAGVILAVSGSAVGLGNFLRFPGQAAEYGGGAFMLAYFIGFLFIGLPLAWAEWTMGRYGGRFGFNSCPGILNAIARHPAGKYLGVMGLVIPVVIYMYYVVIEAWCLGYAVNYLRGVMDFAAIEDASQFWGTFIGIGEDGGASGFGWEKVAPYLVFAFLLNFVLIYRGISKGIEFFCRFAMPTLVLLAIIILVRVLTLGTPDPQLPGNNINNGLGFLWNPTKWVLEETSDLTAGPADAEWERISELVGAENWPVSTWKIASTPLSRPA